jgi:threonine/homoserine efflux transporter RhtA
MNTVWKFLSDAANQTTLKFLGAAIAAAAAGLWAVYKFGHRRGADGATQVTHGGIVAGRDVRNNTIATTVAAPAGQRESGPSTREDLSRQPD